MKKRSAIFWGLGVFLGLYFLLHAAHMSSDLGGTAHGQQGAHFAMADGYVRNDLNFWTPQTRALNNRSDDYTIDAKNTSTITAAHFPIHAYLSAVVQKASSGDLLTIHKYYTLLYGFIGLFFLYLLSLQVTNHVGKSLFLVVFVATAPVFAFYQSNVTPLIPSMANVFIGGYFLHRFFINNKSKHAWIGMTFLLLAALSSSFYFFAFLAGIALTLRTFREVGQLRRNTILGVLFFLIPLIISEAYFYKVRSSYGSQFPDFLEIWMPDQTVYNTIFTAWKMHYFTVFQTIVFLFLIILFWIQRRKKILLPLLPPRQYRFVYIVLLGLLASIFYPQQVLRNDTFFLQALFIPFVFLLLLLLQRLDATVLLRYPKFAIPAFLILLFVLMTEGNWTQMVRHEKARTSCGNLHTFAFKGSSELLKSAAVPNDAELYVTIEAKSGIGHELLTKLDRDGVICESVQKSRASTSLFPSGSYVVCLLNATTHHDRMPEEGFTVVGENGSIAVLRVN